MSRRRAQVVQLDEARVARRLRLYSERLERVMRTNKRAIGRLYTTGLLFTKSGAGAGRDLLLAHQYLLRVVRLLERLGDTGDVPAPKRTSEIDAIFAELDTLLERTAKLTDDTAAMFEELKRE